VILVAIVMTVVSLFYYLRVVVAMYMRDDAGCLEIRTGLPLLAGLIGTVAVLTLLAGIFPGEILRGILAVLPPAVL
jgi:NADH-quinone oxidoreductase subunit N